MLPIRLTNNQANKSVQITDVQMLINRLHIFMFISLTVTKKS